MLTDFLGVVGGHEILNAVRTTAYLTNVGSPFTTGPASCACSTITPAMLGEADGAYSTPATDPAPWFDPDLPVSGDFLGALVLDVVGLDGGVTTRKVNTAIGGGGSFGPAREQPRVITWTVMLIGASCCGADYGLAWLEQALLGCCDSGGCEGESLELFDCCPDATQTRPQFLAQHRRVLRRVALTSGPTVIARDATGDTCASGGCAAGGEVLTVEFTLTAAVPTLWTDTVPLLDVDLPATGTGPCITWCVPGSTLPECQFGCLGAPCITTPDPSDPRCAAPAPPGVTGPEPCGCQAIAEDRECYSLDLSTFPGWFSSTPVFTVRAGSSELRNVKIELFGRPQGSTLTCDEIADQNRCTAFATYFIQWVPANGAVTVDGTTGQATVEYQGGCSPSSSVYGVNNGPLKIVDMDCDLYCLCISVDPLYPPAVNSGLVFGVAGRRY